MENIDNNYALITGGTSGIGFELAKLFAKDKYDLIIVARDQQELEEAAMELKKEGIKVITISKDFFISGAAFDLYEEIKQMGITVKVLVNDAGQGVYGKFIETDLQRELNIIQLNIGATVVLTKLFLKDMVKRNSGKILNVASIAGKVPGPYQAVYHGTKAFVHSFNEAVRNEIQDTEVTLTSLLPGATDTDFFNKADMQNAKIVQEGHLGDPVEVAKDGYEALMAGKDMIVSGFKNKVQVAMSNILPDSVAAENMRKTQEPVENPES
jgi:short-subunit dehydrogenase